MAVSLELPDEEPDDQGDATQEAHCQNLGRHQIHLRQDLQTQDCPHCICFRQTIYIHIYVCNVHINSAYRFQ
jgi:hypothetical protein